MFGHVSDLWPGDAIGPLNRITMARFGAIIANSEIGPKNVPPSPDNSAAVVLLPPVRGRLGDRGLLRWLSRARLEMVQSPVDPLAQVLAVLGREYPADGLAALRMWGQTGDRPGTWIAAADPVYLEPQLDRLVLHVPGPDDLGKAEMRRLFDTLQQTLGGDGALGFAQLGSCGYIRSQQPMVTATVPVVGMVGRNPEEGLPSGDAAAAVLRLTSEIEMTVHEHPVNTARQSRGQPPVNSLWIWGGGHAPEQRADEVLPLYADDPLLRGYWHSVGAAAEMWPGSLSGCLDAGEAGFVAAVPAGSHDTGELQTDLLALRDALRSGRLQQVVLVSEDGVVATLRRSDRLRFWRRSSALLGDPGA